MFVKTLALTAALAMTTAMAQAETFEIQMLNRGDDGAMVFEPAFVAAQPGDTLTFLPTDRGHNAETIEGMIPEGAEAFKSGMNEEFSVTLDQEGVYGIMCTPHYAMGMIMLVQVGEAVNLEEAQSVDQRGKAKSRFEPLFAQVQ